MPVSFDNTIVLRIQQANDIVDVIGEHIALKRKGREMVGLCPFHDDQRPSLNVNPAKQIFKCFACGAGGDVLKFVQMRENLSFPQALRRLAERAGIKLEPPKVRNTQQAGQRDVDPADLARVNAWAAKYFNHNLLDAERGKAARQYLAERKISPESIKKWQLGLSANESDHLLNAARKAKIADKLLIDAGLVVGQLPNLQDKFVNRLMFTITEAGGRVIGFGGRTLTGEGAKYVNSPTTILFDKSNALYGLEHARHQIVATGTAVVVEGYTDCIMPHQFGVTNVVATLGTSFTPGHARMLRRYAKKIVLVFDSDTAGIEAANRALQVALAGKIDIAVAAVPTGKDPCDFIIAEGPDAFLKVIEGAGDVFAFKWQRLMASIGADTTLAARRQALDEYLDSIATGLWAGNMTAVEKGLVINRLSAIIGLEPREINNELRQRISRVSKTKGYDSYALENRKVTVISTGEGLAAGAQREIVEVLLNAPQSMQDTGINADLFDVAVFRQIVDLLAASLAENPSARLSDLLAKIEDVEVAGLVTGLAAAGEEKGNFDARLKGALETLANLRARKAIAEIKPTEDQTRLMKRIYESTPKRNPHSMGLT